MEEKIRNMFQRNLYHVFRMVGTDNHGRDLCVADGPGRFYERPEQPIIKPLDILARNVLGEHMEYLLRLEKEMKPYIVEPNEPYLEGIPKKDIHFSFAFNPPYEKMMFEGDIYSTQRLNDSEQNRFLNDLKEQYQELEDIVNYDSHIF